MSFSVRRRRGFARALVGIAIATVMLPAPLASATTGSDAGSTGSLQSSGLADAVNPDWMGRLPDGDGLAGLSLPGTHDTMASGPPCSHRPRMPT
ncbi:hypothetical protein BTZ20_2520 [Rhodococcus sp. MTM3W5.2]|uniref:hypothetical protein n=1 Tax=Rhodococcus sp. MTM3W5.2 TaxID=1805827 RepID=UPI0009792B82|nr:hypothetical protein [Rhodococcus sp. MTM3W5.2]AQA22954.1 hypothetical protein BTZ20_2520 [Rhodococcus sp. MTM3W5.2]